MESSREKMLFNFGNGTRRLVKICPASFRTCWPHGPHSPWKCSSAVMHGKSAAWAQATNDNRYVF